MLRKILVQKLEKNSCAIADITCTSFFSTKNLGGYGDGGAILQIKKFL